jgi:hypothetical protein
MKRPTIRRSAFGHPTATRVDIGHLSYVFSYDTLVAFWSHEDRWVVHENIWSNVTGRTLNAIDGGSKPAKAKRVTAEDFAILLTAAEGQEARRIADGEPKYRIGA